MNFKKYPWNYGDLKDRKIEDLKSIVINENATISKKVKNQTTLY
jgi:hypothetical protein